MKMLDSILQYVKSWFPPSEQRSLTDSSRKRRATDSINRFRSPKVRRVLSSMTNNYPEDDFFSTSNFYSSPKHLGRTILIDDDDPIVKPFDIKMSKKSLENQSKLKETVDLTKSSDSIRSITEKRLNPNRNGYEFVTRFSPNYRLPTTKSPLPNGNKSKSHISPIFKSPSRSLKRLNSPSLDYSIRLDDKKKYQMLLENVALQNSFNSSSIYGTPIGTLFNRSRKLVDLARTPSKKLEVIDLTNDTKTKLSTKDRVIKILDDFETETAVIEDSDSDVEILPHPPSPKPDIKVPPVNSLKTVVDTSKAAQHKWLDDITKKHEELMQEKNKQIKAYSENSATLNEINKDMLIKSLTKKVQDSLAIKEAILPIVEEEEEVELPPLTDAQLRAVKKALSGGDLNEILTTKFKLDVNRRDIQTLAGLNWLNDNVINFYMSLIIERGKDPKWPRAYAMNTFFYPKLSSSGPDSVKRWTKRAGVDIFSYEFICVPIHLGMHWCMAIINLKERSIKYYDSMGKSNNQCLNALKSYLEFEHQDKKGKPYSTKNFVLENVQDIPQQMNGSDCGMFSCTFAEFATRKVKFSFQQADMPYLRKKMILEILKGELLIQ